MPIYDYRCDHCGHVFSAVQSFSDKALQKCPNCGKVPRRLISMPAIVFKGSGWYKTDSRPVEKSSAEITASADKKATTGGSAPRPPTSETKSATTGETKSDKKSERKAPERPSPKSEASS